MKITLALLGAIALIGGVTACADTVTRKTTTYQQTSSSTPAAPGTVLDDGTTTSKTTKRVDTIEKD